MSPKPPRIRAADLLRALRRDGWAETRRRGSHIMLEHPTKPGLVVIAVHAGKIVPVGTIEAILDQAGLTADGLHRLL